MRKALTPAFLLVLGCSMGLAAVVAPSAGAVRPEIFPQHGTVASDDFPAGVICPFHTHLEFRRVGGVFIVYPNGVINFTFNFEVTFTNVDAGKTRVLHEAGNILSRPIGDDITVTVVEGQELSVFAPGDLGPGSPGMFPFLTGRSVEVDQIPGPNPNIFGVTTLSYKVLAGSTEDLCVTMA
jgi:hypothetical protein